MLVIGTHKAESIISGPSVHLGYVVMFKAIKLSKVEIDSSVSSFIDSLLLHSVQLPFTHTVFDV